MSCIKVSFISSFFFYCNIFHQLALFIDDVEDESCAGSGYMQIIQISPKLAIIWIADH